ncbi:MAG: Uma2 family endonuclease [Labilithrix sp.]|nr:Uma2 family endonuclease [Labilithrix sp.]MCW5813694.1 Uma2 family endonuclease [Labilithrix sp.]
MVQRAPFVVDPRDPRAPTQEQWDTLTEPERAAVVAMLPNEVSIEEMAPEGDRHRTGKEGPLDALGRFFERLGRKVYLSSELAVYYPGARKIVPDVLAVLDVDPRERTKWVVSSEGKGLDFVLEVHVEGDKAKDHERNVALYASLGIPEYAILDRGRARLKMYRLPSANARVYDPVVPQAGRYPSRVLGLDLALEDDHLRFFHGTVALPEADDMIRELGKMVDDLVAKRETAEQRADDAERRLAEALAEIERLKSR